MIRGLVREARPKQWMKNLLVFAAPGALGVLDEWKPLSQALTVFVAYCLAASGVYYWNDVRDVAKDRLHPTKRERPIAAGTVPIPLARVVGTLLVVAGPAVAWRVDPDAGAILVLYVGLQVAYSGALKDVPLLDLAVVASGFVLRAMAGAAGTDTPMSNWFLLCTTFGSFFIVTGKRYSEMLEMGDAASTTRASLSRYRIGYVEQLLVVSCTATVVTYCMWALESASASGEGFPFHGLTIVPMVMALLRYLMVLNEGRGGAPEEVFLGDRALQVYGLAWILLYGAAIYV